MSTITAKKLSRSFYNRPTLEVAENILGKYIVYHSPKGKLSARIVEVEAYIGEGDPACHAAVGMTKRNEIMFGTPGHVYIYFIYGMYHCLNFVTEKKGFPAAVLLRAAEPVDGINIMKQNSPKKKEIELLAGPGLFCRSFALTREQNGLDLTGDEIYLEQPNDKNKVTIGTSKRIGINNGQELPWRFFDTSSKLLSKKIK